MTRLITAGLTSIAMMASSSASTAQTVAETGDLITGISSIIACRQHFVTGLSKSRSVKDPVAYQAFLGLAWLNVYDSVKRVEGNALFKTNIVQYRKGLGCADPGRRNGPPGDSGVSRRRTGVLLFHPRAGHLAAQRLLGTCEILVPDHGLGRI